MTNHETSGGCLCGAVRFTIAGELAPPHACHCSQCVRQAGNYNVSTHTDLSGFTLTEQRGLSWFRSSDFAKRGFCQICGTNLFWQADDDDQIYIGVGSLDAGHGLTLAKHIYVADKPEFYEIHDDLPRHDANPPPPNPD